MNYAMYAVSDITKNQQSQKEHNIVKLEQQEFVYVCFVSVHQPSKKSVRHSKKSLYKTSFIYIHFKKLAADMCGR